MTRTISRFPMTRSHTSSMDHHCYIGLVMARRGSRGDKDILNDSTLRTEQIGRYFADGMCICSVLQQIRVFRLKLL